jgi:hypothetical protein
MFAAATATDLRTCGVSVDLDFSRREHDGSRRIIEN